MDADFEVEHQTGEGWTTGAYLYPSWATGWDRFLGVLGAKRARLSAQPARVCAACGLTVLFVDDPQVFAQGPSQEQSEGGRR
jgi:hypothetical protein